MSRLPQADSSEGASIQGLKFSTTVLSDLMMMMMMDSTPQVGMLSANERYLLARQARSQTIKSTCSYQQKLLPSLKFYHPRGQLASAHSRLNFTHHVKATRSM